MPHWVKLVRAGAVFTGYESVDGVTWAPVGQATVAMATDIYVGLTVDAQQRNALNTSLFDHVTVTPAP